MEIILKCGKKEQIRSFINNGYAQHFSCNREDIFWVWICVISPNVAIKGTVYPKRKMISSFTHSHVKSVTFFLLWNTKQDILNVSVFVCPSNESQCCFGLHSLSFYGQKQEENVKTFTCRVNNPFKNHSNNITNSFHIYIKNNVKTRPIP